MEVGTLVELKGKHANAIVYTERRDKKVFEQLRRLCNQPCMKKQKICVMPDVHECNGTVVGTTVSCGKQIIPALLGKDIGCGVLVAKIHNTVVDFLKLDEVVRESQHRKYSVPCSPELFADIPVSAFDREFGTLGFGNHFMELDYASDGSLHFMIHSGSRSLGKAVAEYYQQIAREELSFYDQHHRPKSLLPLSEFQTEKYLHDVARVQKYASASRKIMLDYICNKMEWRVEECFETVHNYYDESLNILRKGAVSAKENEKLVIPMNMRDGVLLCKGKGNDAWNQSAPHGSGRLLSRTEARNKLDVTQYRNSMNGIYSTSVCEETLDEAPECYKPAQEIVEAIQDTVEIIDWLKPLYNFKNKN